jgi:hypothetical protein
MNFNYATLQPRIQIYVCTKDEGNIDTVAFTGSGGVNDVIFGVVILWYFSYCVAHAK